MKLKIISLLLKSFWKLTKKKNAKSKNKKGYISIKVIGIGCGGCNIIDMLREKVDRNVPLIACDTDKRVIDGSKANIKIKIGDSNWGCGNNSEKGIQEIERDIRKIKNEFEKKNRSCVLCYLFRWRIW